MKNTKKIISIIVCIVFITMFCFNVILASDIQHLQTCHEEHCEQCAMIHQAQNSIRDLAMAITILSVAAIIIPQMLKKFDIKNFISKTLVDSKVQFNE